MKTSTFASIRKIGSALFVMTLLMTMVVTPGSAGRLPEAEYSTPLVEVTVYQPDTLDPALAYSIAGAHVIYQVYEGLLLYNREKTDEFIPLLATGWNISPDGLTYTFNIRSGVTFHNGNSLTPSDVAYSLQRGILQGGGGSPQWLLTEPLLGVGIDDITLLVDNTGALKDNRVGLQAAKPGDLLAACQAVTGAIVANDTAGTVTLHLAQPWNPLLATLAGSWGAIMDKQWVVANAGWDGSCSTWQNYYAMQIGEDPFTANMNGTGPFKLEDWNTVSGDISLLRNNNYWRQESDPLWFGASGGPAYFDHVLIDYEPDELTRYTALSNGSADLANGLSSFYSTLDTQVMFENTDPSGLYPGLIDNSGTLNKFVTDGTTSYDAFFVFQTSPGGVYADYDGTGSLGDGIPSDFFSNDHIRKAFSYAFNYEQFLTDVYGGEAIRRRGPIPTGLPGYSDTSSIYTHNPASAASEFELYDSNLDTTGFKMTVAYISGNSLFQAFAERLAADILTVDPDYQVSVIGLSWSNYQSDRNAFHMPIINMGWQADIPHAHNWVVPFMGENGAFSIKQNLPTGMQSGYTTAINSCVALTGTAAETCYQGLQASAVSDVIDIFIAQPLTHTYLSARVRGFYFNPYLSGAYFYALYKEDRPIVGFWNAPTGSILINFDTSGGGSDSVDFPSGGAAISYDIAVTSDTRLTHIPAGIQPASTGFDLQAFNTGSLQEDLSLSEPAIVNVSYDATRFNSFAEQRLTIFHWDGDSWEDASCGTISRDLTLNKLSVPICHLSHFALGSPVYKSYLPLLKR